LRSSSPSHMSTCNSQRSSQLFFVHYRYYRHSLNTYIPTHAANFTVKPIFWYRLCIAASINVRTALSRE
jgi:hypothetical protein